MEANFESVVAILLLKVNLNALRMVAMQRCTGNANGGALIE
jgi:hypothetical protein